MPGRLTVCGCVHLPIGSDDLAIPAIVGIFFRSFAILAAAALVAIGVETTSCPAQTKDIIFLATTFGVAFITIILYVFLYRVSSSGNMLEWNSRNHKVLPIYHALAIAYCIEVGLGVFGLILVCTNDCPHTSELFIVEMVAVVAIFYDFIILGTVLGLLLLATRGRKPRPLQENSYQKTVHGAMRGMSILCCGLFGSLESPMGNQELAWSEISRVVHAFLKDTLIEFTVPDIFAAFVLLRAEQRAHEAQRVEKALSLSQGGASSPTSPNIRFKAQSFASSTPITGADTVAIDSMKEFNEFSPYMLGIYGWKLQFYMSPLTFCYGFPSAIARRMIYGNNFEHYIFTSTIGHNPKKRQIVYSSFTSYLGEAIPYTITVDHEKKAVVITLRGTMSVGDIATDLLLLPACLDLAARQWGVKDGEKHYTHFGMLQVANRIRTDIEKQQILHRLMRIPQETSEQTKARESTRNSELLSEEDRESFLKAMGKRKNAPLPEGLMYATEVFIGDRELSKMDCSQYRLICCGHSLGSCMASILTVLLRPRFPMIRCLAYSCVSAIFSRELAEESEEYITSCTLGKDIFGRISWHSAKKLREQLLDVIRRSKASKPTILLSVLKKGVPIDQLLYRPDEVPRDLVRQELQARIERLRVEDDTMLDKIKMFMPGKIIYLEKTHTVVKRGWLRSRAHSTYSPVWIRDRAGMQEVQISSRLILDHMPDYLMKVMKETTEREITAYINGQKTQIASSGGFVSLPPPADLNV